MIQFEEVSEEQRQMIRAVGEFTAGLGNRLRPEDAQDTLETAEGSAPNLLQEVMNGPLAPYAGQLFSSPGSGLPVKTNALRLLALYGGGGSASDLGTGLPRTMYTRRPAKYGLSAMGLAAISSGKDGMALLMGKYLPELLKGRTFCYCITEPDAGTNTHKISTRAVDEGDHFVLNGQKTFISAADETYYMVVIARVVKDGKEQGIGTFVVEAETEGISMTPLDIAVLGDPQFSVYFDNVHLPKEALVGEKKTRTGSGISQSVFYTLNMERLMIALITLLVGRDALNRAVARAKQPRKSGPAMAEQQQIRLRLGRAKLKFELASLATKRATEEYDKKGSPQLAGMYANMAKLVASEAAVDACDTALSIYGVEGLNKHSDIGPLYQIARVFQVAPINNEMVLNFLGERLLGLPKSYR
ncbi:MAG: acyl-CoA dehydrogenase [bacterium]|nr:acyl-CoA dehydrogenase [bacterium]